MEIKKNKKLINFLKISIFLLVLMNCIFDIYFFFAFFDSSDVMGIFEVCFLNLIPLFFVVLFFYFSKKFNLKKWLKILFVFLTIFVFYLSILLGAVEMVAFDLFDNPSFISTKPTDNQSNISYYFSNTSSYKISHFPLNLPSDIKNYYFFYESDFHGEGVHYLRFNTNKKYIENEISKNEIVQKIPFEKINDYYNFLDNNFNILEKEKYTVYILKREPVDARYTSGIIASNSDIIFFYADFDIKK